ncbi:MAG: ParB/RepB/Spo0J family partition protein [Bacilli bacterium]|nr:ParB/RepB/Spo0J family partition protein [Bacilli bacterium]
MSKSEIKMPLPKLDDLFTTQKERDDNNSDKVVDISIKDITDFPEHPFKVLQNAEMEELSKSISDRGVLVPVIVRQKENGQYEMISGHRRKMASQLAGKETIPCIIKNYTDDEATLIMVDSNLQREEILPSEKAFAYKMKLEALSHQGKRTDLTLSQVGKKLNAYEELATEQGESRNQIHRYIRLTELIPELLDKVDEKIIAFNPAVELSYLKQDEQYVLLDCIDYNDCTPSLAQAIHLKKMSQEGTLTTEKIESLMEQDKPNQNPKLKISRNKLEKILPSSLKTDEQIETFVIQCVEEHIKRQRQRNNDAR